MDTGRGDKDGATCTVSHSTVERWTSYPDSVRNISQAMAQGVSALADREQTELMAQWQQEDMTHRQLERAWR